MANNAEELGGRLHAHCKDRGNALAPSDAVQSFITEGANVNFKGAHGESVLHLAASRGNIYAVKMLLAVEGIDICAKTSLQSTVVMYACHGGNIEIIKALLVALKQTSNFDINDTNRVERTALMYACFHRNAEVIKLLLAIPHINTHLKDNGGMTALDWTKGIANEDEIWALFQGKLLPFQLQIHSNHCFPPLLTLSTPL
jgi:ankyrin repeat protein